MTTKTTGRLRELRGALQTKAREIEDIAAGFRDETGNGHFVISSEQQKAYTTAIGEAEEIKALIVAEEKAAGILEFAKAPAGTPLAQVDAAEQGQLRMQSKSLWERWRDSEEWQEMKAAGFRSLAAPAQFDASIHGFRGMEVKAVYSAMAGSITLPALGQQEDVGLIERQLRPGRVRDLFPKDTTEANMLWGIRQVGFTNRARPVPERRAADGVSPPTGQPSDVYGLKPKSEIQLVPFSVPVSTIAHLMPAHRNTLADESRMRGLIDRDMVDGIKLAEDEQLLYGDGIGENILGLINTPGVQEYVGLAADKRSAQVRRAITRAVLAYFDPSGLVLHPLDWEDMELETDANGAYTIAISVALGGEKKMWRLPVVDTPAIQEGQFLLGAFGSACKVYDREQTRVEIATENRDDFERNVVTIRAEERLALLVERPEAVVVGTLTTPAA
jgi:hypothetical protein